MTVACHDEEIAPIAAQVPVIVGEIGNNNCNEPGASQFRTLMNWLDAHQLTYLAWVWSVTDSCTNRYLLANWNGTPGPYGILYREHLAGLP